jgi:hypothetical protein
LQADGENQEEGKQSMLHAIELKLVSEAAQTASGSSAGQPVLGSR